MSLAWGVPLDRARAWAENATGEEAFQVQYVAGSAQTVAAEILQLVTEAELDGLMLIFPDYLTDLPEFGRTVLPLLRAAELTAPAENTPTEEDLTHA